MLKPEVASSNVSKEMDKERNIPVNDTPDLDLENCVDSSS